jgi:hypothetical protein
MANLASAAYFLKVIDNKKKLKYLKSLKFNETVFLKNR